MKTRYSQLIYFAAVRRLTAACAAALLALAVFSLPVMAQENRPPAKTPVIDAQSAEPAIARGHLVFRARCAVCHFSDSSAGKIGPGLKGIYKRGKFANGGKVDDVSMEKWIVKGGKDMPPLETALTSVQIRDLLAFLKSL